jgi:hypothetical protein
MFEVITSHTFPHMAIPFVGLRIRVDDLAARFGATVQEWEVDGLGAARGFGLRAPSGRIYLVEELADAVRYQGALGPWIHVDAEDWLRTEWRHLPKNSC